jgi:Integrase core domain
MDQVYYKPKKGLRGVKNLSNKLKNENLSSSHEQVSNYLNKQEVFQVFKHQNKSSFPLMSSESFSRVQLDLLDVTNEIPRENAGVRYLMCLIDVTSRYGFVRTLKTKLLSEVPSQFESILEEMNKYFSKSPETLDSDNESSFISKQFKDYCESKGIHQHFSDPGDYKSKVVVER